MQNVLCSISKLLDKNISNKPQNTGCNNYAAARWVQYMVYLKLFPMTEVLCTSISNFVIISFFTFTQGIYNYIPETIHVSKVHSVAAVLYLKFVLHVMLFRP
jgi:hypothetical protein